MAFAEPDALVKPTPMTIAVIMVNTDWAKARSGPGAAASTPPICAACATIATPITARRSRTRSSIALIRHGSERRPEILYNYPWPARSPDGQINTASMLDMQDWFVKNGFSRAKFPAARLVDASYADVRGAEARAVQVLANPDSKLEGCR